MPILNDGMSRKNYQRIAKGIRNGLAILAVLVVAVQIRGFERTVEDLAGVWVRWSAGEAAVAEASNISTLPKKEWAVVLGASIRSGQFEERVARAAELWKAGKVEKLLLSGDGRDRYYDEPAAMKELLVKAGVPEEVLVLDRKGLSTFESMERAAVEFGVTEAWVITQAYHGPRAVYLAKHHGIKAGVVAAAHPGDPIADESRERKARVKAVFQVWGLAETAMSTMKELSPRLAEVAMM